MTHFFSEYTRVIITMVSGVVALYLFITQIVGLPVAERLGLEESINDEIIYETIRTDNTYTFELTNGEDTCKGSEYSFGFSSDNCELTKEICIGDDFDPMDYVHSEYRDGTDMNSFVVTSGTPEDTETPGVYDITYYLKFEGSNETAKLKLSVQDRSQNMACGVWNGTKTCVFNSDCAPNQKCVATDPEQPSVKTCVIEKYICEVNEDCVAGSTCILPEGATGDECACNEGYCEYIGEIDDSFDDDDDDNQGEGGSENQGNENQEGESTGNTTNTTSEPTDNDLTNTVGGD